jgi:N-acetylglucosamine-6-phosphate deacetylase
MRAALARLSSAREADPLLRRSVLGFHLEGPWLSAEDGPRGAHPVAHCRDPEWHDFRRLQDAADGDVILVTLAPERAGAISFINRLNASGVTVALGHTAADRTTILAAVDAGAKLSTHLGNAAHNLLQRHHNYLWDQLGEDRLFASVIVDGHHLPPHLVDIFLRVKGPERTVLISDAVALTGMPPGVYDAGYRQFEVRADGFIGVLGEPRLAGSGLLLPRGVENAVRFTRCLRRAAWRSASAVPAALLGLSARIGSLVPGAEASLVRFTWNDGGIDVRETILAGQTVFARE